MATSQVTRSQSTVLYRYQDLSHLYYQKQKDSLQKNWTCPIVYKDKDVQKKYKEIWDERTEFFTGAIKDDDYVYDQEVYNYVAGIIAELARANKAYLPEQPFLVLDRSPSVNAYAIGNNVIAVNMGLIAFAKTKEDLAFTLAHELSHNIMLHAENSMRTRAEWLTSAEYKASLEKVLDSKYERLTRLKRLMETYSFDRSRHQRYHESDADSLAIVLLKNAHMAFDPAFFLRLDTSDMVYRQPLKQPVKDYFTPYGITIDEAWLKKKSKGLSTRNYNFQETTTMQDSLKTHPDCIERYNQAKSFASVSPQLTAIPPVIKDKAVRMMIWNMYCNMNLAPCLYRVLLEKDNGSTDPWYDFMLHNIMLELSHADKDLHRFSAIGVTQKEYISKDFYELQTLLEQIPRDALEQCGKSLEKAAFWNQLSPSEKAFRTLLHTLAFANDAGEDAGIKAAKAFADSHDTSLYREYADDIKKN